MGRGLGLLREGVDSQAFENEIAKHLGPGSTSGNTNYDAGKTLGYGVEVKYGQAVQGGLLKHSSVNSSSFTALSYTKGGTLTYAIAPGHDEEELQKMVMADFAKVIKANSTVADWWYDQYGPESGPWDLFQWQTRAHLDPQTGAEMYPEDGGVGLVTYHEKHDPNKATYPGTRWGARALTSADQNAIYRARGAVYMVEGNPADASCYLYHFGNDPLNTGCKEYASGDIFTEMKMKGWTKQRFCVAFQTQGGKPTFSGMKFDSAEALGTFLMEKKAAAGNA